MIELIRHPVRLGPEGLCEAAPEALADGRKKTISYGIMEAHNTSSDPNQLKLKFDSLISHDITYVGIIQTARASGLKEFPLPYICLLYTSDAADEL